MRKLLLLLSFTVFAIGGDIQAPAEGTVWITDDKIIGGQCIQNLTYYKVRWSKTPFSATNEGAILSPYETTCLTAKSDIYIKSTFKNVPIQVWEVAP